MLVCYKQFVSSRSGKKYMALEVSFGDYFTTKIFPKFEAPYLKRYLMQGVIHFDVPDNQLAIQSGYSEKNGKDYRYIDIPTIGKMKERVFLNRYTVDLVSKYLAEVRAK